jgi:hypothetical protein
MKLAFVVPVAVVCLLVASVRGQAPQNNPTDAAGTAPPKATLEAEVLRRTTGREIDASGFATKPYHLEKGQKFDVVSQELADVVLSRRGLKLRLPKGDVRIYEKDPNAPAEPKMPRSYVPPQDPRKASAEADAEAARAAEAMAIAAFKPGGELVIISAKYSLTGNAPRNVKSKIDKMIPAGPLTAPVRIIVSDQLSRAAANEPDATVIQTETSTRIVEWRKNVLTVVFQYNGQKLTKQAVEGTALILP